jgi:hypothetical protein
MTFEGTGSSLAVESGTAHKVFETSVERILVLTLGCGQQVVAMGT